MISSAHRAPGALTCRMVTCSEGRLTSNETASNSDYDSMPRKPPTTHYHATTPDHVCVFSQVRDQRHGRSRTNSTEPDHERLAGGFAIVCAPPEGTNVVQASAPTESRLVGGAARSFILAALGGGGALGTVAALLLWVLRLLRARARARVL